MIDFADQELLLLQMLQENKTAQTEIGNIYKLVMVDEFQDSNPVQLAIFNELKKIVESAVWVGDQKQAIYGFRDSDPVLFQEALAEIAKKNPANIHRLQDSYRSREGIVNLVNTCFTGIFKDLIKKEHVTLTSAKQIVEREKGYNAPALHVEFYNDTNLDYYFPSIALQVKKIIESDLQVFDKTENRFRKIKGGDIALLFRTNSVTADCAAVFRQHGIPVSCEAEGLQAHAEVLWIKCLLRLVINPGDPLAIAQLAVLEEDFESVEAMLKGRLEFLESKEPDKDWKKSSHTASIIDGQTKFISIMPLVQAVRHLITASNLYLYCARWGNDKQRLANIDKVVELTIAYEEQCNTAGSAASFPGFLDHLCDCFDVPPIISEDAVTLITAHRAKGMEWPMVYLVKLDSGGDDSRVLFNNVHVRKQTSSSKTKSIPRSNIIFLPWPFGAKHKLETVSEDLIEAGTALDAKLNARARAKQEEDRLLYVAFTRARDYLVLPYYKKSSGCGIEDDDRYQSTPFLTSEHWDLLKTKATETPTTVKLEGHTFRVQSFPVYNQLAKIEHAQAPTPRFYSFKRNAKVDAYAHRYIIPSRVTDSAKTTSVKLLSFSKSMIPLEKLTTDSYARIGTAIHNAFASWNHSSKAEARKQLLEKQFTRLGVSKHLQATHLDDSFKEFFTYVSKEYAPVKTHKEIHLTSIEDANGTITTGIADLVLETEKGLVLIDHKTFPGHFESMALESGHEHFAGHYAGQLEHYKAMLEKSTGKKVVATLLHYVVQGKLVEVEI